MLIYFLLTSAQNYTCKVTAGRTGGLAKSHFGKTLPCTQNHRVIQLEGTLGDFLVQTPAQIRVKSHQFVHDLVQ